MQHVGSRVTCRGRVLWKRLAASHRVCLARTRLTVREDGAIVTHEAALNEWLDALIVDILLCFRK